MNNTFQCIYTSLNNASFINVLNNETINIVINPKLQKIITGDFVKIIDGEISEYIPRKNVLKRSNYKRVKNIAANIDLIFIICAPSPLFNKHFLDRLIVASLYNNIEFKIILNKIDILNQETKEIIKIYKELDYDIIKISAKDKINLEEIKETIELDKYNTISFLGVSGVGKSTLMNSLLDINIRTSNVSKIGQGRQTTSLSIGYRYKNKLLIDHPGIQNFMLSYIDKYELKKYFKEYRKFEENCKYTKCQFDNDKCCIFKNDQLLISESRYESYLTILDEIIENKKY